MTDSIVRIERHANSPRTLLISRNLFRFEFSAKSAVVYGDDAFVLLNAHDAPFVRNIDGFKHGRQTWQAEDPDNRFPDIANLPIEEAFRAIA